MDAFLASKGVTSVAYYGWDANELQHVAKKAGGNGLPCAASSKLGPYILIAHNLKELEYGKYGIIVGGN